MTLKGGCFCGRIRFETDETPRNITICHCVDCRRATGSPMVGWFTVGTAALRFLLEAPRRFASSPGVTRSFCPGCGTSLTYRRDKLDEVDVTICSLDEPDAVVPVDHVWTERQLGWVRIGDGLPRHGTSRAVPAKDGGAVVAGGGEAT